MFGLRWVSRYESRPTYPIGDLRLCLGNNDRCSLRMRKFYGSVWLRHTEYAYYFRTV